MKTNSSHLPPPTALSGQENRVTLRSPDNGNGVLIAEIDPQQAFCRSLKLATDSANESGEIEFFSYHDWMREEFSTLSGLETNFSLAESRHWWDGVACPPIPWTLAHYHNHPSQTAPPNSLGEVSSPQSNNLSSHNNQSNNSSKNNNNNPRKTPPSSRSNLSSLSNMGGGSSLILTGELHQANNGTPQADNGPRHQITLERSMTLNWQREMVVRQTLCANADNVKIEIMQGLAIPVSLAAYKRWTAQTVPDFLNVKYLENISNTSMGGEHSKVYAGSATPRALTLLEEDHKAELDNAIGVEPYEMLCLSRDDWDWGRSALPTKTKGKKEDDGGSDGNACPDGDTYPDAYPNTYGYGLRVSSNALHLFWQLARVNEHAYLFFDIQSFPVLRRALGTKDAEQKTFPPRVYGQLRRNQPYQTTTLYQFI